MHAMDWHCAHFSYDDWVEFLKSDFNKEVKSSENKMLSNWTSYLFGYGSAGTAEEQENMNITTIEADDGDWLVVDTIPQIRTRSRSSSPGGMEESWFVTPPPCFTSQAPMTVETSPLENLLIEHPSMSVYRRVGRSLTPPEVTTPTPPPPPEQVVREPLRPAAINTPSVATQLFSVIKGQKAQIIRENKMIKLKFLERGNKTKEFNGRNKKQRRADRQKHLSGANNNRKCC